MNKEIILILIGIVYMLIQESEVNTKQYYDKSKNKGYITKIIDQKSDLKRKYKLIIEEEYICESDSPHDIEKIINSYCNYT